jgi:flagellar biogenesis protein FliO
MARSFAQHGLAKLLMILIISAVAAPLHGADPVAVPTTPISITDPPAQSPGDKPPRASVAPTPAAPPAPAIKRVEPEPTPPQEELPLGRSATLATDGAAPAAPAGGVVSGSSSQAWILQTLTALGLVVALILLVRWLITRVSGAAGGVATGGVVEVLGRQMVGPRLFLLFLRVGDRIVIASQSTAGLQPLTELTDPEEAAIFLSRLQAARPSSISHGFKQLLGRFDTQHDPEETADDDGDGDEPTSRARDEVSGLLARLRAMKGGGK